jgi:hypothetical protein
LFIDCYLIPLTKILKQLKLKILISATGAWRSDEALARALTQESVTKRLGKLILSNQNCHFPPATKCTKDLMEVVL